MASLFLLFLLLPLGLLILFLALSFLTRPKPVRIPIKNRHVLITGGSSGIGLALAKAAAAQGAHVSILARNLNRLEEAREEIKLATGHTATVLAADVRDPTAVTKALEEAGPVDVLVCNQGVFVPMELEKQDLEEAKFMIDVNLMGTFHLIKAALPGMKRRSHETQLPASIAIMSSQAGQVSISLSIIFNSSLFLFGRMRKKFSFLLVVVVLWY
jgi:3-dehydrosphinganine reductase